MKRETKIKLEVTMVTLFVLAIGLAIGLTTESFFNGVVAGLVFFFYALSDSASLQRRGYFDDD